MPVAPARDPLYRGYRFPAEIISHAVWLYSPFALSHRDVEELLAERGVQVSYEAICLWCQRFEPIYAGVAAAGVGLACLWLALSPVCGLRAVTEGPDAAPPDDPPARYAGASSADTPATQHPVTGKV